MYSNVSALNTTELALKNSKDGIFYFMYIVVVDRQFSVLLLTQRKGVF